MSIRTYPTYLLVNTGRVILRQAAVMGLVAYKKFLGISPYNVLDGFLIYVLYFLVVLYGGKKALGVSSSSSLAKGSAGCPLVPLILWLRTVPDSAEKFTGPILQKFTCGMKSVSEVMVELLVSDLARARVSNAVHFSG